MAPSHYLAEGGASTLGPALRPILLSKDRSRPPPTGGAAAPAGSLPESAACVAAAGTLEAADANTDSRLWPAWRSRPADAAAVCSSSPCLSGWSWPADMAPVRGASDTTAVCKSPDGCIVSFDRSPPATDSTTCDELEVCCAPSRSRPTIDAMACSSPAGFWVACRRCCRWAWIGRSAPSSSAAWPVAAAFKERGCNGTSRGIHAAVEGPVMFKRTWASLCNTWACVAEKLWEDALRCVAEGVAEGVTPGPQRSTGPPSACKSEAPPVQFGLSSFVIRPTALVTLHAAPSHSAKQLQAPSRQVPWPLQSLGQSYNPISHLRPVQPTSQSHMLEDASQVPCSPHRPVQGCPLASHATPLQPTAHMQKPVSWQIPWPEHNGSGQTTCTLHSGPLQPGSQEHSFVAGSLFPWELQSPIMLQA
mmetsp:Transcript_25851/g.72066  ORF Transcript_25851/g.72066 Transcript_25851/m.72066 type:complete len:419 (+) Transcript_25851:78-1334(+)